MDARRDRQAAKVRWLRPLALGLVVVAATAMLAPARSAETVLHSFKGGKDGWRPYAGLAIDNDGALYGTTYGGGGFGPPAGAGTVFKLTPPTAPAAKWTRSILHRFQGGARDGESPFAGVVIDESGALYGTTSNGGSANRGTVFKLTPPAPPKSNWTSSVLYSFKDESDGKLPWGGLARDGSGALYGTTYQGGGFDPGGLGGTVFKLTPPTAPSTKWTRTILYRFKGGDDGPRPSDGALPWDRLILDGSGALYGTTTNGGGYGGGTGFGTVFKLTPPEPPATEWIKTSLYRFKGGSDGAFPRGLILDGDGSLYGATGSGGVSRYGTVYKLIPPQLSSTSWSKVVLYNFTGGADGNAPQAELVLDGSGALYGATSGGGLGYGAVFKLTPPTPPATVWTNSVLHSFAAGKDGWSPDAGLIGDGNGTLYGTTSDGGADNAGTVFKVD